MPLQQAIGIVLASWVLMQCLTFTSYPLWRGMGRGLRFMIMQIIMSLAISLVLCYFRGWRIKEDKS